MTGVASRAAYGGGCDEEVLRTMKKRHGRRWFVALLTLGLFAALASGCTSAASSSQPDTLNVTMTSPTTTPQNWASQDGAAVQKLYQHIQNLQQTPHTVGIACQPAQHTYKLTFVTGGKTVLTATTWTCQGYIQISSDTVIRRLDSAFWQELSGVVGQTLATN
jgi:hypothetical protein